MKRPYNNKIIQIKSETNFAQITYNITKGNKLTDFATRLYGYLKSHNENFYISYSAIAKHYKISEFKVKQAIKELKQSGFLEIERQGNNFIYKLYNDTENEEYKINESIKNNQLDFTDVETIYKILNNEKITAETREKIKNKLNDILHAKWF